MLSRGLRIFAARSVPLVVMVIFSMNICGQEEVEAEFAELVIGCRDTPSRSSAVSLEVTKAWVEGNELFGDLLVANHSEAAIRLPRENVGRRYWHIAFVEDQHEPIAENESGVIVVIAEEVTAEGEKEPMNHLRLDCGGLQPRPYREVLEMSGDPLETIVAEKDIERIAPGQTVLLRAVNLAPFWSVSWKPGSEWSFEVTYTGWSSTTVSASAAEGLTKPALAEASARHCSLYGGELKSNGHFLTP
jgi:hypothetical protein